MKEPLKKESVRTVVILQHLKQILRSVHRVLKPQRRVWCELSSAKNEGTSKKRKCEDGGDSSTSQADSKKRPPGVKASKASGKKTVDQEKQVKEFERIWTIKHKEMEAKERLSKMILLDSLIGKKELLPEYEESLKKKLINDLF
ncbi:hypothetical protein DY000_02063008 [Brassica cretica]|uniref:No apical meristem-associated C-terminal domain-containing protein n=1 Tax=Brassica cretica TaxID=69181 RepID=A0ABQ7AZC6_BRACR|nr:hypothetical protein DY000_02063008 [Brassica cretica]